MGQVQRALGVELKRMIRGGEAAGLRLEGTEAKGRGRMVRSVAWEGESP